MLPAAKEYWVFSVSQRGRSFRPHFGFIALLCWEWQPPCFLASEYLSSLRVGGVVETLRVYPWTLLTFVFRPAVMIHLEPPFLVSLCARGCCKLFPGSLLSRHPHLKGQLFVPLKKSWILSTLGFTGEGRRAVQSMWLALGRHLNTVPENSVLLRPRSPGFSSSFHKGMQICLNKELWLYFSKLCHPDIKWPFRTWKRWLIFSTLFPYVSWPSNWKSHPSQNAYPFFS